MVPVREGNDMRKQKTRIERFGRATLAVAILSGLPSLQAWAQSTPTLDTRAAFNIPAGSLAAALDQFSTQAGIQTLTQPDQLAGKQVGALSGQMTWREALGRLLHGTGLEYRQVNATTVVIRPASQTRKPGAGASGARSSSGAGASEKPVANLQSVTVTGTRIRGGTTPSPVITIGSENMREEGFTNLGEVIRDVPQNFGGGQNPEVGSGGVNGAGPSNQNVTGGSSLNLRGLGPDATLTLLNGRRLSYAGIAQAVDISAIPMEAVDRIEIVADGASAIYGSDAVGGVGNVILKRDFDGVTVGTRYRAATEGGLATREYTATAGTTWSTGGLIATYKDASIDPIYASQRSYTDQLIAPTTIYPASDLHSGLVSAHQSLGDNVELRLDALRTKRDQLYYYYTGSGLNRISPGTTTTLVAPSIEFLLPSDWSIDVGGTWGKDTHHQYFTHRSITTGASSVIADDCYCDNARSIDVGAEGPIFSLPGGDARLAVGMGYRQNKFLLHSYLYDTDTTKGSEDDRFAYAEVNFPLISPDQGIAGFRRLAFTAAVRGEDYNSFGRVTTPKLGLVYGPNGDFTLKASWGKSFKAPTLFQQKYTQYAFLDPVDYWGGTGYPADSKVLDLDGGNPRLKPERARTWTTSLAFHPEALPDLDAELTWFDINYTNRVVLPIPVSSEAMRNPVYAEFIDYSPAPGKQAEVLSEGEFINDTDDPYDPSQVVAIVRSQYTNVASQKIHGLDLTGSYQLDLRSGRLAIRGSATWLNSSQKTSPAQQSFDLSGTIFNPAKLKSRVGAVWTHAGFAASLFANYTAGVTNPATERKTASFTTFDTTLSYGTGESQMWWSGLEFSLSAQNLLDRKPPLYTPVQALYAPPYDGANYTAVGRFLSISVSKHW